MDLLLLFLLYLEPIVAQRHPVRTSYWFDMSSNAGNKTEQTVHGNLFMK